MLAVELYSLSDGRGNKSPDARIDGLSSYPLSVFLLDRFGGRIVIEHSWPARYLNTDRQNQSGADHLRSDVADVVASTDN